MINVFAADIKKPIAKNIYIFDLDQTLWDGQQLYPDVHNILSAIRLNGHYVYIASFNSDAPNILNKLGINHLFHGGAYGQGIDKHDMILQILHQHKQPIKKIEFFDDLPSNIVIVKEKSKNTAYSITAKHTPNGLSWHDIISE
jgi:hypothetical protein